jgi:hypothetical protein
VQWTEQAVSNPAYSSDALALQAGLYLERRDYHRAKQVILGAGTWGHGSAGRVQLDRRDCHHAKQEA